MTRSGHIMAISLAVLAIVGPSFIRVAPKLVWNASASVPIGLYAVSPPRSLHVGDIAVVTLPEPLATLLDARHSLPRGVLLIKPVAALAGQTVCRRGLILTVDGAAVGAALARDHLGRPLPVWDGCRVLGPRDVFLMNPNATDSFDGRYFSVLPISAVIGRAAPLWFVKGR
ncbi:MAG: S26 family signal peptidase [Alphaproteobacteria bacterium]|jgi:conjugative transfer signal peptidase TraF|nr:S26 family signal peptidase [Alphaproteobacteria bacterium]MBN9593460.1 S26 family signal peptidase [Alphaproteobacteria bacterium]